MSASLAQGPKKVWERSCQVSGHASGAEVTFHRDSTKTEVIEPK